MAASALAAVVWVGGAGSARAQDKDVDACIASSEQGQVQRDEGKLLAARDAFVTCARATCPSLLQRDCAAWLADVEARLPSIVVSARDADGRETPEVQVTADGAPLLARLHGRAVPLDPGEHVLRFEHAGSPAVEQRVLLREGEQRRLVEVRFARPVAGPPVDAAATTAARAEAARPVPVAAIALAGGALAGGAVFAGFAASAKSDYDALSDRCAPWCGEAEVDAVRVKLIVANSALGVGLAALTGAAVVWLLPPEERAPASSTRASLALLSGGGAAVSLSGRF